MAHKEAEFELRAGLLFIGCAVILTIGLSSILSRRFGSLGSISVIGSIVGFLIPLVNLAGGAGNHDAFFESLTRMNEAIFFNMLLPPIVFGSGFGMMSDAFFRRIGTILWFALFGTLVSFLLNFLVFYLGGVLYISTYLSMTQALLLSTILSATDMSAVVPLFRIHAIPDKVAAIALGETMFNDAVAFLLYALIMTPTQAMIGSKAGTSSSLLPVRIFGKLVAEFVLSLVVGVLIALSVPALIGMRPPRDSFNVLKRRCRKLWNDTQLLVSIDHTTQEAEARAMPTARGNDISSTNHFSAPSRQPKSCTTSTGVYELEEEECFDLIFIYLSPWISYLIGESVGLSGVLVCLFCGLATARYAPILNRAPKTTLSVTGVTMYHNNVMLASSRNVFQCVTLITETASYIFLGSSLGMGKTLLKPFFDMKTEIDNSGTKWWLKPVISSVSAARLMTLHGICLVAVSFSRLIAVWMTSTIVNKLTSRMNASTISTRKPNPINFREQLLITFCGVRGATSVALAIKAKADLGGGAAGSALVSAALIYTIFTVGVSTVVLPKILPWLVETSTDGSYDDDPAPARLTGVWGMCVRVISNMDSHLRRRLCAEDQTEPTLPTDIEMLRASVKTEW